MKQSFVTILFAFLVAVSAPLTDAQDTEAKRIKTRDTLAALLEKVGPTVNIPFRPSTKQSFNYTGSLTQGLANAESFEVVVSVTANDTIGFRIFPHYKKGYINVDKAKDSAGLMRLLLRLTDRSFLFWGIDTSGDVFTGYTFTLESGFPEESIRIVLRSIVNSDKFIGEMRPFLDGTAPVVPPAP